MLHAGFGRPAVRPAAVRCCALQRPSIDLAACPHWLGHCGCWRDRGGGTGAPLLHAGFGSCRGSGSATSALLSALQSALLLSAAAPCSVRVSVRDRSTDLGCLPALGRLRNPRAACTGSGRCRREQHF